jgi:hypothetical protein
MPRSFEHTERCALARHLHTLKIIFRQNYCNKDKNILTQVMYSYSRTKRIKTLVIEKTAIFSKKWTMF